MGLMQVERRLDREAQRSRACMTQDTIQKVWGFIGWDGIQPRLGRVIGLGVDWA